MNNGGRAFNLLRGALSVVFVFGSGSALAQEAPGLDDQARQRALERLDSLEKEVSELRQLLGTAPPPVNVAPVPLPICSVSNVQEVRRALADPTGLTECIPDAAAAESRLTGDRAELPDVGLHASPGAVVAEALAGRTSVPIADRANPASGVTTTLEVAGDSSKASIALAHPLILRKPARDSSGQFLSFRPQLLTLSGTLATPVVKGERVLFENSERLDRGDFDVLPGTTLKLAADFLNFASIGEPQARRRVVEVLTSARKTCLNERNLRGAATEAEFLQSYGLERDDGGKLIERESSTGTPAPTSCAGADLVNYILETKNEGTALTRPALAAAYQAAFWDAAADAIPQWGFGFSVEYGTSDFKYRQGSISLVPTAAHPSRVETRLETMAPLAASETDTRDDWKVQAYLAGFLGSASPADPLRTDIYTQGVMIIGGIAYTESYQFRPGTTDLSICPVASPPALLAQCSTLNVDRPYATDYLTLSIEGRSQIRNIPIIGTLGLAPKFTYRPEDNRNVLDFPIYLSATAGVPTAGIRWRRYRDGRDLLGNPEKKKDDISIFLSTPLSFRKF